MPDRFRALIATLIFVSGCGMPTPPPAPSTDLSATPDLVPVRELGGAFNGLVDGDAAAAQDFAAPDSALPDASVLATGFDLGLRDAGDLDSSAAWDCALDLSPRDLSAVSQTPPDFGTGDLAAAAMASYACPSVAGEVGAIWLARVDESLGGFAFDLPAQFGAAFIGPQSLPPECPCVFLQQDLPTPPDLAPSIDAGGPSYPNAGAISFVAPLAMATLQPDSHGQYTGIYVQQPLFQPGDVIQLSAAGADVPPFSATITAPSNVTVTNVPADGGIPHAPNQDLVLDWSGGDDAVLVSIGGPVFEGISQVVCIFPAANGTGVVPGSLIDEAFEPQRGAYVRARSVRFATVGSGAWTIVVRVDSDALLPNGQTFWPAIDFQ